MAAFIGTSMEMQMPKIERIVDETGTLLPLRVTRRSGRRGGTKRPQDPSIRVKCGCCSEAVVICYGQEASGFDHPDYIEINGVYGTVDQWRTVLGPLLGIK